MKKNTLQIITLLSLVIGALSFFVTEALDFHVLSIKTETSKSILSTLIGATGSMVGFIVIYLSISFENLKRNYGQYGTKLFQSNSLILTFLSLLILTILISLFAFILSDSSSFFKNFLLNISFFYFFISLILLIPYGYAITKNSSYVEILNKIIEDISPNDFTKKDTKHASALQISTEAEKNRFIVVGDILINSAIEKNNRFSNAIAIQLIDKVNKLLYDNNIAESTKLNITAAFCSLIREVFSINLNNKNNGAMLLCFASVGSLNETIAKQKLRKEFVKEIYDLIGFICKSLIEAESETLSNEAMWTYYHASKNQLQYNTPKEDEIWQKSQDPEYYVFPINTNEAFEKESLFDLLNEYTSYRFNNIVERSFLCKNHHITEDCVKMLGSFVQMIAWTQNLGEFQRHTIGSMLSYHSANSVKRFSTMDIANKANHLRLFFSSISLMSLLKTEEPFSKSVFDNYIDLADYLSIHDKLDSFDLEDIFGLGRLIIASWNEIPTYYENLEELLLLADKINTNDRAKSLREKSDMIEKGVKSFLSIMEMRNIKLPKLKELIEGFVTG